VRKHDNDLCQTNLKPTTFITSLGYIGHQPVSMCLQIGTPHYAIYPSYDYPDFHEFTLYDIYNLYRLLYCISTVQGLCREAQGSATGGNGRSTESPLIPMDLKEVQRQNARFSDTE
jgi:hypothetical protein